MSLRKEVLRGGSYLVLRQGIGTMINILGVLLLTRTLGPHDYGVYAAAAALFATVQLISQLGIPVYIVRHDQDPTQSEWWTASIMMFLTGLAAAAVMIVAFPFVQHFTRIPQLGAVGFTVIAVLPLNNLAQVPLSILERRLDYKRSATIEVATQALFFIVALPLALRGWGAWAPTLGFVAQQVAYVIATHALVGYWPRFSFNRSFARAATHFGTGFTLSIWLFQLRRAVNPLLVGRYLGAEAVAIVAVTIQIVTHLNFITVATWRLSTAAFARVQHDSARLARAVSDAMTLQSMATAPLLVAFAWLAPFAIPRLIGREWGHISLIYPYVAAASLVIGAFAPHSSALYVLKKNVAMATFHIANVALLALGVAIWVPRVGLIGYGFAELLALLSYTVLHAGFVRNIGRTSYEVPAAVTMGFGIAIFPQYLGLWSLMGLLLVVVMRPWRRVQSIMAVS